MEKRFLGGHSNTTHIDEGALNWLIEEFNIKSAIDVGCGPGGMVNVMRSKHIRAYGVDGDASVSPNILHDFRDGPLDIEPFHLCWSVEFLEHIRERDLSNVWPVIEQCQVAFITHGLPDTASNKYHNCQNPEYWIAAFQDHGFAYDPIATAGSRQASTMKRDFVKNTGMVFVKC